MTEWCMKGDHLKGCQCFRTQDNYISRCGRREYQCRFLTEVTMGGVGDKEKDDGARQEKIYSRV